jgi:hypothetical protein
MHWRHLRVALRHGAGELRGSLNEQHTRHERPSGEMSAQEWLVAAQRVLADAVFAGSKRV